MSGILKTAANLRLLAVRINVQILSKYFSGAFIIKEKSSITTWTKSTIQNKSLKRTSTSSSSRRLLHQRRRTHLTLDSSKLMSLKPKWKLSMRFHICLLNPCIIPHLRTSTLKQTKLWRFQVINWALKSTTRQSMLSQWYVEKYLNHSNACLEHFNNFRPWSRSLVVKPIPPLKVLALTNRSIIPKIWLNQLKPKQAKLGRLIKDHRNNRCVAMKCSFAWVGCKTSKVCKKLLQRRSPCHHVSKTKLCKHQSVKSVPRTIQTMKNLSQMRHLKNLMICALSW